MSDKFYKYKYQRVLFPYIVGSAGILFGFDTGNIAGALPLLKKALNTSLFQDQLIVSVTIFFAFLSAVITGRVVDRLGSRNMLIFASGLFVFGALQGNWASSVSDVIIMRIILGVAIGISSYASPMYISEMAKPGTRGKFVLFNGIAITLGEVLAFICNICYADNRDWRQMFFLSIIPASYLLLGMLLLPHSKKATTKPQHITNLLESIYRLKNLITKIIRRPESRRPLIIGISLGCFQQFFGINSVMYYGPIIFEHLGLRIYKMQLVATLLMGCVNLLGTISVSLIVDRVGRRTLLLFGSIIAVLSLSILAVLYQFDIKNHISASITLMSLYILGYCISVGSLFWLIISEIYPSEVRGLSMGIATGAQWLSNFVNSYLFLWVLNIFSIGTIFMIYAGVCVSCILFVYLYVPETAGLPLSKVNLFWKAITKPTQVNNL